MPKDFYILQPQVRDIRAHSVSDAGNDCAALTGRELALWTCVPHDRTIQYDLCRHHHHWESLTPLAVFVELQKSRHNLKTLVRTSVQYSTAGQVVSGHCVSSNKVPLLQYTVFVSNCDNLPSSVCCSHHWPALWIHYMITSTIKTGQENNYCTVKLVSFVNYYFVDHKVIPSN